VDYLVVATALAEMRRFDDAVAAAEDCLFRARDNEDGHLVREVQRRLDLFRGGRGIFDEGDAPPAAQVESESTPQ
jgi:hypothetical protein